LLGSAYAFKSGYEFSIEHARLRASQDAGRTFDVLRDLVRRYPDLVDAKLITGAFSVIADSLDLKTKWLAWLLGYRGNLEEGRCGHGTGVRKGFLENDDARTLLAIVYTGRKLRTGNGKTVRIARSLPENYLVIRHGCRGMLLTTGPGQHVPSNIGEGLPKLGRAAVLSRLGVASRMAGDFAESERRLREASETSTISPVSLAIARLELGKTLDLEGQRGAAVEQYRRVLQNQDVLGIHQDASRWMRKPFDRAAMRQDNAAGGVVTLGLTPVIQ
jgi:hypothetical protein